MKRVPTFWWDFRHAADGMWIVIESDDPAHPVVYKMPPAVNAGSEQIAAAERVLSDLRAGRRDYRRMATR